MSGPIQVVIERRRGPIGLQEFLGLEFGQVIAVATTGEVSKE